MAAESAATSPFCFDKIEQSLEEVKIDPLRFGGSSSGYSNKYNNTTLDDKLVSFLDKENSHQQVGDHDLTKSDTPSKFSLHHD